MTTTVAIQSGLRLAQRRGIRSAVWVVFFVNLALAALASLPLYRGALLLTGHSLMSRTLASAFSSDWLTDFAFNSTGSLTRYAAIMMWMGLFSIPVNAVLAGGVLAQFREPSQRFSLSDFFHDSAHYAWRLIRLMIIGLICYWIIFRVFNQTLGNLVEKRIRYALDDRTVFWARLLVTALVLGGVSFVNLVIDYARVKLVMEDGFSAVEAFLASLGFCLGRFRKALCVYALPALCGLGLLGIYLLGTTWVRPLTQTLPQSRVGGPFLLALIFIGQQIVMFSRYWFRAATWASEWSYWSEIRN